RIVPLHYKLKSGDRVEVLTSKSGRGPSRDWLSLAASSRAKNKIRQFFSREQKEDLEAKGRESLESALKAQNLPYRKLVGSAVLAGVIRESGFKKAEDFYLALGKGITVHRGDCPNVRALMRNPERFTPVEWDGGTSQSFRVQIAVDSWDRPRLLEDVARTFAEHGANIVSYGGAVEDQMAKNWY